MTGLWLRFGKIMPIQGMLQRLMARRILVRLQESAQLADDLLSWRQTVDDVTGPD